MRSGLFAVAVAVVAAQSNITSAAEISGTATVTDGDTIRIEDTRIRLHGIDAPEGQQSCERDGVSWLCGQEAASRLRDLVAGQVVNCFETDRDQYGRTVAVCTAGEVELGAAMVSSGLALAYREFGQEYVRHEAAAQGAGRGLWAGTFVDPWDWRSGVRLPSAASRTVRADCQIKGNINRSGDRIYHVPGSPSWDQTVITESRAERFFCTEEEAQEAGWRAPR